MTQDSTGFPIDDVIVEIIGKGIFDSTNATGAYKTGIADSGRYDLRFYKRGCATKIVTNVLLRSGQVTSLDVALACTSLNTSVPELADERVFQVNPSVFNHQTSIRWVFPYRPNEAASITIIALDGRPVRHFKITESRGEILWQSNVAPGYYSVQLVTPSFQKQIGVMKLF